LKKLKTIILVIILFVVVSLGVLMLVPVSSVNIVGNEYYFEAQLESYVFENAFSRRAFMVLVKSIIGIKKDVPFVSKLSIKLTGLTSAQLQVTPKDMMGYVTCADGNKYFNSKGVVVESSSEIYPGIPQVLGIDTSSVAMGAQLPTESLSVLNELLEITQFLSVTDVQLSGGDVKFIDITDKIEFDEDENIYCYFGDIKVSLGVGYNLEGKLIEMAEILPSIEGKSGVLHLEGYDPSDTNHVYLFE